MDVGSLALGESTEQALGVLGLILPGEGRVVEGARGLANNDHRGVDRELLEAAQHDVEGVLDLRRDVGEAARAGRRRRRTTERARASPSGALPRARTPLQVCTPRLGGYARAGARQGAFAVEFRELNGVFGAFAVLNAFGVRCATGDALRGGRATRSDPQNGASSRAKPAPARARR